MMCRWVSGGVERLPQISPVDLDEWVLELGNAQGNRFKAIAQGNDGIANDAMVSDRPSAIATLAPQALANRFYQLRLTTTDLGNRTTTEQVTANNVAPTLTQSTTNTPINEGELTTFSVDASDLSDDIITDT